MVPPVCKPLQPLLSPSNPNPSAFHTLTKEALAPVISIARDLYQRGSLVRTCGGSATPPCPTVSFFAFPGAPSPAFYDISGCLADVFPRQLPAFTAGIVLLLNIWGAKRAGGVADPAKEMEVVHKCMGVLRGAEGRCVRDELGIYFLSLADLRLFLCRWHAAGRLWCVFPSGFVSWFDGKYIGTSSTSWHPSATCPSPCRARPLQNASATRIVPSLYNPVRARAQVTGRHYRSRSRTHHISHYNNSHSVCLSRRRRAASVAVAERRSSTSCTPRTRPRRLRSKSQRIYCPTHRHSRASRMRICRRTATSSRVSPVTCSNRGPRRGSRLNLKRTRTVISNTSTNTNTRRRRSTRLPQVTRGPHTGRRRAPKHTRRSSRRRSNSSSSSSRWGPGLDMGKMGTWTYGTRCRLATSAYSFRLTLAALAPRESSGIG
jgi:hypothetical protein